jgi:general secretion pathway protein D
MRKTLTASLLSYLLVALAEGPLALAQTGGTEAQAPAVGGQAGTAPGAPPAPPPAGEPPPVAGGAAAAVGGAPAAGAPGTAPSAGGAPGAAPGAAPIAPAPLQGAPPPPPPPAPTSDTDAPAARRRAGEMVRSMIRKTTTPRNGNLRSPSAVGKPTIPRNAPKPPSTSASTSRTSPRPLPARSTPGAEESSGPVVVAPPPPNAEGVIELPGEKEFNQCKKLPPGKRIVKFNFKPDTDIADIVAWISSISCTQFLVAGSVLQQKKVTILSPQLITPEEAYRLFLAAMESVGLTVEPMGKFLRIFETGRARFTNLPFYREGDQVPGGDKRYITRLFRFDNLDPTDVLTNLYNQIRGEQGVGVAYQGSLIITDQAVMLERFAQISKELDIPSVIKERIWMVRVKNTSATEMASRLAEIFQIQQMGTGGSRRNGIGGAPPPAPPPPQGGAARPGQTKGADLASQLTITKLIPDERSNHLIVVANERAYEWLLTILRKLDVPIEGGGDGRFHIYYCEHANCDELAATLSAVTGVSVVGGGGARRTSARTATPGAPPPTPIPTGAPGQQGAQSAQFFEGDVRVTFDAATNALVVYSSLKDFQALRRVIEKLDSPRKQVYVEATIMEVILDKSRDINVGYHAGFPQSIGGKESTVIGGYNASQSLSPASLATDLVGLTGAVFGPALNAATTRLFGVTTDIPSFGVFIKILQKNNDVNVLSSPHLLITNNQEGEISVGQNLPFPGGILGGFGGGAQAGGAGFFPQVSVQRQDVSLKMKLIPSVNEQNMIKLDVDVEISDLAAANFNGLGPATTKRTAKTPIFCKDQQTVVIGGLMSDRTTDTVQKIPILGDIPVIGFLFRNTSKQIQKTNIIIALTPYVISDMDDLRRVAEKKLRERREFIEMYSSGEDTYKEPVREGKTRGMLEEINRTAHEIDEEEEQLRALRARDAEDESTPIERESPRKGKGKGKGSDNPESESKDKPSPPAQPTGAAQAPEGEEAITPVAHGNGAINLEER